MNQDQKPARVRAVASGSATPDTPEGEDAAPDEGMPVAPEPAAPGSLPGKILFLLGCAMGGGAIAALPHLYPMSH